MGQCTYNFNAGGKPITAAASTVVFSASEISGDGVAAYYISMDNGDTISTLDRIRCKSAGSTIWDLSIQELISYIQRASRSNFTANIAVDTSLTIPLYVLDGRGTERYSSGFPNGQSPTVEVVRNATGAAGNMFLGWRLYDTPYPFYSMCTGTQTNVPANSVNFRVPVNAPGLLRYFGLNITGLDRLRLVINGQQLWDMSGAQLLESQQMEGLDGATAGDFMTFRLQEMVPVTAGNSYAELSTNAAWLGVQNEFMSFTLVPQADTLQPKATR